MKRIIGVAAALALLGGVTTMAGLGKEPKKEKALMKKKLAHAQKVLEGVAVGNFKLIAANAEKLIEISKAAQWKTALRTPKYELYSNEFRRIADKLVKKAEAKNLDGAALAYVEMTLTCVRCHRHVREVRKVQRKGRTPLPRIE
jgi:hypothetical protein